MFVFWCLVFCPPLTSQMRCQRWGNATLHSALLKYVSPLCPPSFPNFVGCWHLADTESNTNRSDKVKHHSFLRGGSLALIMFPLKLLRCDGAADLYSARCQACPLHLPLMGSIDIHRSEWLDLNRSCSVLNKNSSLTLGDGQAQAGIWKMARARRRGSSGFLFTTRVGWGERGGIKPWSWEGMHRHCLILLLTLRRMQWSVFAGDRVKTPVCSVAPSWTAGNQACF